MPPKIDSFSHLDRIIIRHRIPSTVDVVINRRGVVLIHGTVCEIVTRISVVRHVGDMIHFDVPACTGYLHSTSPGTRAAPCTARIMTSFRRWNTGTHQGYRSYQGLLIPRWGLPCPYFRVTQVPFPAARPICAPQLED